MPKNKKLRTKAKEAKIAQVNDENMQKEIDGWNNFSKFKDDDGNPGLNKEQV